MSEFSMEQLAPLIAEVIDDGGEFRLYPRGTSMRPLIRQGIDSVALVLPKTEPKRGDILLYQRSDGQYVLHRLMRYEKDGTLCFSGDNHKDLEYGISNEQIIATVAAVFRREKRRDTTGAFMQCYGFLMTVGVFKNIFLFARRFLAKFRRNHPDGRK